MKTPEQIALPLPETPARAAPRERKPRAVHPKKPGSRASRKAAVREERESRQAAEVMAALGSQITDVQSLVAIGLHAIDDAAARGGHELEKDTPEGQPGSAVLAGVAAAKAACAPDYWATVQEQVTQAIRSGFASMYLVGQLRADKRLIRDRRTRRPDVADEADPLRVAALRRFNALSEAVELPIPPEFRFDEDAWLAKENARDPWSIAERAPRRVRQPRKAKPATEALHPAPAGKAAP